MLPQMLDVGTVGTAVDVSEQKFLSSVFIGKRSIEDHSIKRNLLFIKRVLPSSDAWSCLSFLGPSDVNVNKKDHNKRKRNELK